MRCFLGLVVCASLLAGDASQLRDLENSGRMFELRRALQQPGWDAAETRFYRAVIAGRFGHETEAIPDLQQFLATHPDPELERKAYEELAGGLERLGRYGEAANAWAGALRVTPAEDFDRPDSENTRALDEALRDIGPQTIEIGEDSTIQAQRNGLGSWDVPLEVNRHQAKWIFDTGANLSTISESEAAKMGLAVRETGTYVRGSTRAKNPLRVAVARDLHLGNAGLSNVVFLVLADQALYIGPLKYQIAGILGLPVIRALARVEISAKGVVQIGTTKPDSEGEPNLFYDELSPITEARHDVHPLQLFLDTGANETVVYPSFRAALTKNEISTLGKKREKTAGAGGVIKRTAEVITTLRLEILSRAVEIPKVSVVSKQPKGNAGHRDGVLGMDALAEGFTLDFRSMQLQVQ